MADMAQPPQQGVLKAQEAQNEQTFTANMMDLRLQLLSMRADYLNQLNTQATLVGGAAIGLLSSGELTVVNELSAQRIGNDEHCNTYTRLTDTGESCVFSDFEGEWADRINNYLYMASACGCLASSIWVLYTSTNLVQFGTLAALMPGENNQGTEETMRHTDLLIHHRMADVRKMFVFSLVCLIMSVMMMVWEHFEVVTCNFWIAFLIFLGFGVHAWSSDGSAVAYYERFSGLQVASARNSSARSAIRAAGPSHHAARTTAGRRGGGSATRSARWRSRSSGRTASRVWRSRRTRPTIGGGWRRW